MNPRIESLPRENILGVLVVLRLNELNKAIKAIW